MHKKLDAYTVSAKGAAGIHAATITLKGGYTIVSKQELDDLKSGCAHGLTKRQADRLRGLIVRHSSRQTELAHVGVMVAEDAEQMRREAIEAAEALWEYVRGVTL